MHFPFPKIYPILDSSYVPRANRTEYLRTLGQSLTDAGVTLLEYRNKTGDESELLADARTLREALPEGQVRLIFDDRADLVAAVGFDGVHVDAGDVSPAEARRLLGPDKIVGTFGGSTELLPGILECAADYLAIGPVYPTTTKNTGKAAIGPEGVARLRAQAGPGPLLVAAAGITLDTAPLVLAAGADAVAVAAALFQAGDPAAEFEHWLRNLS